MKFKWTHQRPKLLSFIFTILSVFAFTGWTNSSVSAQTCTYTIQMIDSFGDGWNGGFLTVNSDGVETTHTLLTGTAGTSTFQVTAGAPITITWTPGAFVFEVSFNLLNADGIVILSLGQPVPVGQVYNALGVCPTCPVPNPNLVIINQITDSTAFVNWLQVSVAESYFVQYGPQGFPLGTGIVLETTNSNATLTGLNPCVDYDAYISVYCGVDSVSSYIGPYTFQTTFPPAPPGGPCTYTLELFDSFGDGWNGSVLTVTHNGVSTNFTLTGGSTGTFTFDATGNLPINFSFSPGAFLNETSYNIVDPNGVVIFSDGPFPQIGNVFSTIACPTCPGPLNAWMSDVNATNAILSWLPSAGATGPYIIEYGPMAFTLGTGTVVTVNSPATAATLTGLSENSWYNVYIKLDCGTEFSKTVGPLIFHTIWLNDVGVSGIFEPDPNVSCDLEADEIITIGLRNYGQTPQTLFEFYFAVNGQVAAIPVPQDGLFTGVVGNDSTQIISFETTWDFSAPGFYLIEAWTSLEGDSNPSNDTFRVEIVTAYPKPINEDFEDNAISPGWSNNGFIYAPFSHNNETYVLGANLFFAGQAPFFLAPPRTGPVEAGDTLFFDYRYVDWFADTIATTLGPNNKLEVLISSDCEETYETALTINSTNHVASTQMATMAVPLDDYVGDAINIRFVATWGNGDYWIDLDNINLPGCPESLLLLANVNGSVEGAATGSINLTAYQAQGTLTVFWLNAAGDTVSTVEDPTGLPPGTYTAFVTDANGCQDSKSFDVGILVSTDEVAGVQEISLYPNPTSGRAFLDIQLTEYMDIHLRLLNMNGQVVFESEQRNTDYLRQELDLFDQPPGMYIIQVMAGGKRHFAKLMVAR